MEAKSTLKIGILGGGPAALFMYKRIVEEKAGNIEVHIFEKGDRLGVGMPYGKDGANDEHITNVSASEIPVTLTPVKDWIHSLPKGVPGKFKIDTDSFNEYKTLPRLLFGRYLNDQFKQLIRQGKETGIKTTVHYRTLVTDIIDNPGNRTVQILLNDAGTATVDKVVVCTGHHWPKTHETIVPAYYDSPYPPSKLKIHANHPVAIRGSSLTAVDAVRTLSRSNGTFSKNKDGSVRYNLNSESAGFKIVMHSRNGLLPALRFHLENFSPVKNSVLTKQEINAVREKNDGFVPLDHIFEKNFKAGISKNDPDFYEQIKTLSVESFVERIMSVRESVDAFDLLEAECAEAEKSIKRQKSIHWKELLGELSIALSAPAKYFPAEDMLRLRRVLMPLISVVIAHLPQSSAAELLALHKAGCLEIVTVGDTSEIQTREDGGIVYCYPDETGNMVSVPFKTFVDCIGQPALAYHQLPFKSLLDNKTVSAARLYFRNATSAREELEEGNELVRTDNDGRPYLVVPGLAINDCFQVIDDYNAFNERIYIMAVPFIGGFNPDYSGLDFCEASSEVIIKQLLADTRFLNTITTPAVAP